ncbi:MAG: polymorphic toxin type 37 domain-containing protein, partial [Gemmataceae bacterium]
GFEAGDANLYRYVGNAPGDGTDPEGLSPWDYFQPWAAVQGVWEGGGNIIHGVFNFGKETVLSDIDVLNSTLAWASGERYGYWGYLSSTGNAIQNGNLTVGEYYHDAGANAVTFGTYGELLTLFELYYGQISLEQASERLGTTGALQLCGAGIFRGKGPSKPYTRIPATLGESPGPGWVWRGQPPVGGGKGAWFRPSTGESLHPDLNHPGPIGPHWDWRAPDGTFWRLFPDGRVIRRP